MHAYTALDYFQSYPQAIAHTWNILARHIIIKVIMMYIAIFFSAGSCTFFQLTFWQFLAATHEHNVHEDYH